jgi:hypothetical protein
MFHNAKGCGGESLVCSIYKDGCWNETLVSQQHKITVGSSHISHQTGAELFTFPAQMTELIELIMDPPNNQIVSAIVAILPDRICRGNGMSTRIAEMKPSTGNSGYNIGAR